MTTQDWKQQKQQQSKAAAASIDMHGKREKASKIDTPRMLLLLQRQTISSIE
jgi:hypothetical protein